MQKGADSGNEFFNNRHRLEHWYRDNTVYFLTVSCSNKFHAFASKKAREIFWAQFDRYRAEFGFEAFICSLMHNHYHTIGYLRDGKNLAMMLQRFHGATAKLVNDLLPRRIVPFWSEYFDGCLRDEKQYRRAFRYAQLQSVRHGICTDWREYGDTRISILLEEGLRIAMER